MQDEYTGQAGTFIVDGVRGIRIPLEQYEAEQAEAAAKALKETSAETIAVPAKAKPTNEVA
jgi:hypothetical protein